MISLELRQHLTSKTNARAHWSVRARSARAQRVPAMQLVEAEMRKLSMPAQPFRIEVTRKVSPTTGVWTARAVKHLSAEWQAVVDRGITVTFTRLAPRPLDDDNLRDAFKSVRDGVADAFGVTDADKRFTWRYAQEKASPSRITITISWPEAE